MRTTFSGIEIARRALIAQQRSLDVTAHNVANANTPGYSRQEALHRAVTPFNSSLYAPSGIDAIGMGVEADEVRRLHDDFIETQLRQELKSGGRWNARRDALEKIQYIFNEPSDNGIRSSLDLFWQSLQELANNAGDLSIRSVVRQRALGLTDNINHVYKQLIEYRRELSNEVTVQTQRVNDIAHQIADLNKQVQALQVAGQNPNDLLDRRDLLIQDLAETVNIAVVKDTTGVVNISISGVSIINGTSVYELEAVETGLDQVIQTKDGLHLQVTGGRIAGLLESRLEIKNGDGDGYADRLDAFAYRLLNEFNAQHSAGFTLPSGGAPDGQPGGDFFTDPGGGTQEGIAGRITLSDAGVDVEEWLKLIAASDAPDDPGSGENALRLARLLKEETAGQASFYKVFGSIVSSLGVAGQEAKTMVENQETLVHHLTQLKESVSGVSLDEEMTNMIRFQHAYQAAARMMTAMDEILDTIINRVGLVGR